MLDDREAEWLNMLRGPPPMSWLNWYAFRLLMECRDYAHKHGGQGVFG